MKNKRRLLRKPLSGGLLKVIMVIIKIKNQVNKKIVKAQVKVMRNIYGNLFIYTELFEMTFGGEGNINNNRLLYT